jgi:hypothetical protein
MVAETQGSRPNYFPVPPAAIADIKSKSQGKYLSALSHIPDERGSLIDRMIANDKSDYSEILSELGRSPIEFKVYNKDGRLADPKTNFSETGKIKQTENNCFMNSCLYMLFGTCTSFDMFFNEPVGEITDPVERAKYEIMSKIYTRIQIMRIGVSTEFTMANYLDMVNEIISAAKLAASGDVDRLEELRFAVIGTEFSRGGFCSSVYFLRSMLQAVPAAIMEAYHMRKLKFLLGNTFSIRQDIEFGTVRYDEPIVIEMAIQLLKPRDKLVETTLRETFSWRTTSDASLAYPYGELDFTSDPLAYNYIPATIPRAVIISVGRGETSATFKSFPLEIERVFYFRDFFAHANSVINIAYAASVDDALKDIQYDLKGIVCWEFDHYSVYIRDEMASSDWWFIDPFRKSADWRKKVTDMFERPPIVFPGPNPFTHSVMFSYTMMGT